jgi:uncharacterized repeat protein (TIGR03803 family)
MLLKRDLEKRIALSTIALTLGLSGAAAAAPATHAVRALVNAAGAPTPRSVSVLHSFAGTDGSAPVGSLDLALAIGNHTLTRTFYGVTEGGGVDSSGTIYSYTLGSNVFGSVYAFTGANDGGIPDAGLATNETNYFPAGQLQLGVAIAGGASGNGTLFAIAQNGTFTLVHTFTGGADGGSPAGRLTLFTDGNYYGTTSSGGLGFGTVYRVTPAGVFSTIYTFTGGLDGGAPQDGLSLQVSVDKAHIPQNGTVNAAIERAITSSPQYVSPYLYGTTSTAGVGGAGTIFRITPSGTFQLVYGFSGGADGGVPAAKLTSDLFGNLFGTTTVGGVDGNGVVFVLPANKTTPIVLYDFGNGATGAQPQAQLTIAFNGNLYGTTTAGGASGQYGSVFEITRHGSFYDIHDFAGTDGANPQGALVDGGDGNLYGTTVNGGAFGQGELFSIPE